MPYITQLRVAEIATSLATLFKGEAIFAALEAADNNIEVDLTKLLESELPLKTENETFNQTGHGFNLHNLKGSG